MFAVSDQLIYKPFNSHCPVSLCHITITEADVYEALVSLNTSKAMGPDGIPPILLSKCASVLYIPLHYLFNLTLKFGYLPCEWKVHKIIPVFKSGDPNHINNYRLISLLSNTSKVLERILHDKIIGHVTSRINPAQFVFIQNHSSVQQLLLVLSDTFLPLVISWISFTWISPRLLILFLIHIYFTNFVCSILAVNSGHGFWHMLLIGLNLYQLMPVIPIFSLLNQEYLKVVYLVLYYSLFT